MAKRIKNWFKKAFFSICGFLGLNFLTSCGEFNPFVVVCMYGMPADYQYGGGTVVGDIDNDGKNEPVPGIKYSYKQSNYDELITNYTDENGAFYINDISETSTSLQVTFDDVDGEANGQFQSKTVTVQISKGDSDNQTVTLDSTSK